MENQRIKWENSEINRKFTIHPREKNVRNLQRALLACIWLYCKPYWHFTGVMPYTIYMQTVCKHLAKLEISFIVPRFVFFTQSHITCYLIEKRAELLLTYPWAREIKYLKSFNSIHFTINENNSQWVVRWRVGRDPSDAMHIAKPVRPLNVQYKCAGK